MMGEMRKFMAFALTLALSGNMALAMEEDAMDEMMEAPAPSLVVGGSGKIGIRNVDDSSKPNAEQFKLVRAYKVTFDSTGTTDGGLMFGGGNDVTMALSGSFRDTSYRLTAADPEAMGDKDDD